MPSTTQGNVSYRTQEPGTQSGEQRGRKRNSADHHAIPVWAADVPCRVRALLRVGRSERGHVSVPGRVLCHQGMANAEAGSAVLSRVPAKAEVMTRLHSAMHAFGDTLHGDSRLLRQEARRDGACAAL